MTFITDIYPMIVRSVGMRFFFDLGDKEEVLKSYNQ